MDVYEEIKRHGRYGRLTGLTYRIKQHMIPKGYRDKCFSDRDPRVSMRNSKIMVGVWIVIVLLALGFGLLH